MKESRSWQEDSMNSKKRDYRAYYAKVRDKKLAANKVWMREHKEYRKDYAWKLLLKNKYGITPEGYNALFEKQRGKCAICGAHQSEFVKRLYVDHNHNTGRVRALLCVNCNMLIGHAREKLSILMGAIEYLKKDGIHE